MGFKELAVRAALWVLLGGGLVQAQSSGGASSIAASSFVGRSTMDVYPPTGSMYLYIEDLHCILFCLLWSNSSIC